MESAGQSYFFNNVDPAKNHIYPILVKLELSERTQAAAPIGLGLVGLYTYQAEEAGPLGPVAFVVTFIGGGMAAGSSWREFLSTTDD